MGVIYKIIIASLISFLGTQSYAENPTEDFYRNFWNPLYHQKPLSYCNSNQQTCGLAVANLYCQCMGYKKANKAIEAHNVRLTTYFDNIKQCLGWECSGFKLIRCVGFVTNMPPKEYHYRLYQYDYPRLHRYRVDWCYKKDKQCGKPAAYSFCRQMGYLKAQSFSVEEHLNATKTLADQTLCLDSSCKGFKHITCFR